MGFRHDTIHREANHSHLRLIHIYLSTQKCQGLIRMCVWLAFICLRSFLIGPFVENVFRASKTVQCSSVTGASRLGATCGVFLGFAFQGLKPGLWWITRGFSNHFCDTLGNLPRSVGGRVCLGSPYCCITEVDSISHSPGLKGKRKTEVILSGYPFDTLQYCFLARGRRR